MAQQEEKKKLSIRERIRMAREEGFSDEEIKSGLSKNVFKLLSKDKVSAIRDEGFDEGDIADYYISSESAPPPRPIRLLTGSQKYPTASIFDSLDFESGLAGEKARREADDFIFRETGYSPDSLRKALGRIKKEGPISDSSLPASVASAGAEQRRAMAYIGEEPNDTDFFLKTGTSVLPVDQTATEGVLGALGGAALLNPVTAAGSGLFFGLGAIANRGNKFSGYAVPARNTKTGDEAAHYIIAQTPIEAAMLRNRIWGLSKDQEGKLPPLDYAAMPDTEKVYGRNGYRLDSVGHTPHIYRVFTKKSIGEMAEETVLGALSGGSLAGVTPGSEIARETGSPAAGIIADLAFGAASGGVAARAKRLFPKSGSVSGAMANGISDIVPSRTSSQIEMANTVESAREILGRAASEINAIDSANASKIASESGSAIDLPAKSIDLSQAGDMAAKQINLLKGDKMPIDQGFYTRTLGTPGNALTKLNPEIGQGFRRLFVSEFTAKAKTSQDAKLFRDIVKPLPREYRANGNRKFFELIDDLQGKPIPENLDPKVKDAISAHRNWTESKRAQIVSELRSQGYEVPDDWGIDGYIHHLFRGNLKITATDPTTGKSHGIGRAVSLGDAKKQIAEYAKSSGLDPDSAFSVEPDIQFREVFGQLNKDAQIKIAEKMASELGMTPEQRGQFLKNNGLLERRGPGYTQQRYGAKGYSQDYLDVMDTYSRLTNRWIEVNRVKGEVLSLAQQAERAGYPQGAAHLKGLMDTLSGAPDPTSVSLDNTIASLVGPRFSPGLSSRLAGAANTWAGFSFLTTGKFLVNQLFQPLLSTWPTTKTRYLAKAYYDIATNPQVRAQMRNIGFEDIVGKYDLEPGIGGIRKLATYMLSKSEQLNQQVAYRAKLQEAIDLGFDQAKAHEFALVEGNLKTQFLHSAIDQPQFNRNPISKASIGQFSRFKVKELELYADILRSKNPGAIGKALIARTALGGAGIWMTKEAAEKIYKSLRDSGNEKIADTFIYGLPAMLGTELSSSYDLTLLPHGDNIYERIGRLAAGPTFSTLGETVAAMATEQKGGLPSKFYERGAKKLIEKIPLLRELDKAWTLARGERTKGGEYVIRDSRGYKEYLDDTADVWKRILGFKDIDDSKAQMIGEYFARKRKLYEEEQDNATDWVSRSILTGNNEDLDKATDIINRWNEANDWQDVIDAKRVFKLAMQRAMQIDKTRAQRFIDQAPKKWRPYLLGEYEKEGIK